MKRSDKQLLDQLKAAQTRERAFRELIQMYQKQVYGLIRKMVNNHDDADDLVQEVFTKVWSKIDTFNEESMLFTWIYRIAVNECLQFLRRKKRWSILRWESSDASGIDQLQRDGPTGDEIESRLQKAIMKLPDQQRIVFHMKYYDDLKYSEMAAIMQRSEGSLKANYHHAVSKIEKYLNEN